MLIPDEQLEQTSDNVDRVPPCICLNARAVDELHDECARLRAALLEAIEVAEYALSNRLDDPGDCDEPRRKLREIEERCGLGDEDAE